MKKTACITGASSGIGEQFAIQLARKQYNLILIARSTDKLDALAKKLQKKFAVDCEVIPCDLSEADEVTRLIRILKKKPFYLFINNAGLGDIGYFDETSRDKDLQILDVNVRALHLLMKEVLADFIARDSGYLLNVASVAGLMPGGPLMASYYASKAYVVSLTSSVSKELRMKQSKVRISALCPGPVDTNFNQVAGSTFSLKEMSAAQCVAIALRQMDKGKLIITPGWKVTLSAAFVRFVPRGVLLSIISRAQHSKIAG